MAKGSCAENSTGRAGEFRAKSRKTAGTRKSKVKAGLDDGYILVMKRVRAQETYMTSSAVWRQVHGSMGFISIGFCSGTQTGIKGVPRR